MQDLTDPRQGSYKDSRDLAAPEIPRRKDEHPRPAGSERGDFQRAVSEPLILGEHNPPALADCPKPDAVFLIPREMVVMDLDREVGFCQFRADWIYAQRPVDEDYRFIRRLRSGLLLRWHWCLDGSPLRGPRRNRQLGNARRWMKPVCLYRQLQVGQRRLTDS